RAIESLTNPKPTTAQTRPQAFVWGDRVFESKSSIEVWLRQRGINYDVWAKRHPAAVGIMYPRRRHATPAPTKTTATPKPKPDRVAAARPLVSEPSGGRSIARNVERGAIVVLPLVALLLAAGSGWYARRQRRWNRLLPMRVYLVASAA